MPHPIYGPPSHALERVTLTLHLPTTRNGHITRLEVQGRSSTTRETLWSLQETWTREEQQAGLQPCDAAHHALLVASQDRCSSQSHLEASLTGQGWEQLSLPL